MLTLLTVLTVNIIYFLKIPDGGSRYSEKNGKAPV